MLYCMNNQNRDHAQIFGVPDAFYDLNGWGRQAREARKLTLGTKLLLVSQPRRDQLKFEEWQYTRDETRVVEGKPVQLLCGSKTGQVELLSREAAFAKHPVIFRRSDGRPALKLGWSILGESSKTPDEVSTPADGPEGASIDSSAEWLDWMRGGESFEDWATAAEGLADLFATEDHTPEKQRAYPEENAYWVEIRMPLSGMRLVAFQLSLLDLRPKVSLKTWFDEDSPNVYRRFAGRRFFFRGQLAVSYEDQSPNGSWAQQMKQKGVAVRGVVHDIALAHLGRPRPASEVLSALFLEFCKFTNACFDGTSVESTAQAPKVAVSLTSPEWQTDAERMEELLATVTSFNDTERDCLVKARIGQTIFRRQLLARWGMKCSVTGLANPDVLVASHIVPWSRCAEPHERWDVENGLLLTPGLDRAFELGLIGFDLRGRIIVSSKVSLDTQLKLGIDRNQRIRIWYEGMGKYLERHRALHALEA